ncbi:MAG: SRPBCC domain-containing protein [Leptospira sp.]|nr:SRPBCC domain-containing protein [Leptospira sp.]
MKFIEVYSEIQINANKENLWQILTTPNEYNDWNPFIKQIFGKLELNEHILEIAYANDFLFLPFEMVIKSFKPNYELVYESPKSILGEPFFFGHHRYLLEETAQGHVLFSHTALFSGLIALVQREHILTKVKAKHEEMNSALKLRAESTNAKF